MVFGFDNSSILLRSSSHNLISAIEHPEVVSEYIQNELNENRIALVGPKTVRRTGDIHLSPLGTIPKKGRPNQWRLIMDLSAPGGTVSTAE